VDYPIAFAFWRNMTLNIQADTAEKYFSADSPLCLRKNLEQGRYIIARRAIKAGERVMSTYPYAYAPSDEHKSLVCAECLRISEPNSSFSFSWYKSTQKTEEHSFLFL